MKTICRGLLGECVNCIYPRCEEVSKPNAEHEELAKRQRSAMPGTAKPLPEGWYDHLVPKGWDKVD